jgi:AAHS family 3-hydroxyphenylpropionic acid transporter
MFIGPDIPDMSGIAAEAAGAVGAGALPHPAMASTAAAAPSSLTPLIALSPEPAANHALATAVPARSPPDHALCIRTQSCIVELTRIRGGIMASTAAGTAERPLGALAAVITLVLCFCGAVVEGIDLQSMGLAAPKMGPEFHLSRPELGLVLSATPLGLFFGAFIGGRIADAWGRKAALMIAMVVYGVFQLATTVAPGYEALLAVRFCCGLGLGGALPNLIALTSEAAGPKSNLLNVVITAAGMPTGGGLASYIAFLGGEQGDWRTIFYIGGIAPLALAPIMALALPESRLFQEARAASRAAGEKVNSFAALFGQGRAAATLLLWIAFFSITVILYLLLNWLPVLMGSKGFSKADAALIQIPFNAGSAIGSILLGWMMQRRPGRAVLLLCYLGLAAFLFALAQVGHDLLTASAVVALTGAFLLGAQYILYGLTPTYYRTATRGTGTGAAVAASRLGSTVGPSLAGYLLGAGKTTTEVLQSLLPVAAVSAVAAMLLLFCRQAEE